MQKICLVIPCFNEAKRIRKKEILDFLNCNPGISFCFVNDGSIDDTDKVLQELKSLHPLSIITYNMERNSGKAETVRSGILFVEKSKIFDTIGFWDADFATPLSEILRMIAFGGANPEKKAVIGSRIKRMGATIDRKATRHILGRIFSTFSNWILKFPVYDSQCGAKIFKSEVIEIIFKDRFKTKWLFDIEILARIRNNFGTQKTLQLISEFPLNNWSDIKGSKLRMKDYFCVPFELIRIHFTYNVNDPEK